MFLGHVALALAVKSRAPRVSLGVMVAAVNGLDLLWPLFLLLGIERVRVEPGVTAFSPLAFDWYPWSHSLLMAMVWAVAAGLLVRWRGGPGLLIGLLIVSHWVFDLIVHRPDLPLWPGPSPHLGFGLWDSVPGTLALEITVWLGGILTYVETTRPTGRAGIAAFWSLIVVLTAIYLAQPWSPPPSTGSIAWFGLAGFLVPFWAAWADRHRVPAPTPTDR